MTTLRNFFRHPSAVPVRYTLLDGDEHESKEQRLRNISGGGISFDASEPLEPATLIRVTIRVKIPPFECDAIVIWCKPVEGYYEIGVQFINDDDNFNLRMVEQVCQIEQYKRNVYEKEGRRLNHEEAAVEWIKKHAKDFPRSE